MAKKRLAIVGNGMAASRLLDDLDSRGALRRFDVAVFGEEPGGAYNRILLSGVLGGEDPDSVVMKRPSWYEERGVALHPVRVDRIDGGLRTLHTADGASHRYDVVVFATGSSAFIPEVQGMRRDDGAWKHGVFAYRTLDDCLQIRSSAKPGDNAVVVGGGLLGLEAAKALSDLGLHVTVVHLVDALMNVQLDAPGADMLRKQIERCGIFIRTGRSTKEVLGGEKVEAVVLDDGAVLPADLVVFACGVRPRVDAAKASKLPVKRGIVVNDVLATEVPGVYALGECCEHRGVVYGIVAPIYEQSAVLADVLSGADPQARYRGSKLYARLKVAGVDVASMGAIEPALETDEVLQVVEPRRLAYRKLLVRGDRLIGAMLVGDVEAAAGLIQIFDRGDPLPVSRLDVLCSLTATAVGGAAPARTVCNCHKVSESTLVEAIQGGCGTVEAVMETTRAGTGCGTCRGILSQLVRRHGGKLVAAT